MDMIYQVQMRGGLRAGEWEGKNFWELRSWPFFDATVLLLSYSRYNLPER